MISLSLSSPLGWIDDPGAHHPPTPRSTAQPGVAAPHPWVNGQPGEHHLPRDIMDPRRRRLVPESLARAAEQSGPSPSLAATATLVPELGPQSQGPLPSQDPLTHTRRPISLLATLRHPGSPGSTVHSEAHPPARGTPSRGLYHTMGQYPLPRGPPCPVTTTVNAVRVSLRSWFVCRHPGPRSFTANFTHWKVRHVLLPSRVSSALAARTQPRASPSH